MNSLKRSTAFLSAFLCLSVFGAAPEGPRTESGVIAGALYTYIIPEDWNGKLFMIAHGFEPEGFPLVSEFDTAMGVYAELLEQGWLVAKTSYRRSGLITDDAVEDLVKLHELIVEKEGAPMLSILEGQSMGGLNAAILFEKDENPFDGALALGPAINFVGTIFERELAGTPKKPFLIVANRTEHEQPASYVEAAKAIHENAPIEIWKIDRDGHGNMNYLERGVALEALVDWIEEGIIVGEKDNTVPIVLEGSASVKTDAGLEVPVRSTDPIFGNIILDIVESDFDALGLKLGDSFKLDYKEHSVDVLLGSDYSDASKSEWVTFQTADAYYVLFRYYASATEALGGIEAGESVSLSAKD